MVNLPDERVFRIAVRYWAIGGAYIAFMGLLFVVGANMLFAVSTPLPFACLGIYIMVSTLTASYGIIDFLVRRLALTVEGVEYSGLGWSVKVEWKDLRIVSPYWGGFVEAMVFDRAWFKSSNWLAGIMMRSPLAWAIPLSGIVFGKLWRGDVMSAIFEFAQRSKSAQPPAVIG